MAISGIGPDIGTFLFMNYGSSPILSIDCHIYILSFVLLTGNDTLRRKKDPRIFIPQCFRGSDGLNYLAGFVSVQRPWVAIRRGVNPPYFAKQSDFLPYSPQELKIRILRDFSKWLIELRSESEPDFGLFYFIYRPLFTSHLRQRIDEEGRPFLIVQPFF
jgi:hypothetical protein